MKQFKGVRELDELREKCQERGWTLNAKKCETEGSDYVQVLFRTEDEEGQLLLSLFNGRFFGSTLSGKKIDSSNAVHDEEAWFSELLNVIYLPL